MFANITMGPSFSPRTYQPRALEIIDTTLREGQQSSLLHDHFKYYFTTQDKLDITRALILFGVKFIEVFAPNVSAQEAADFTAIRQVRDELVYQRGYAFLLAHVRCHPADVEAAIAAGADGLNMYIGTSDVSVRHKHGFGLDEIARRTRDLLEDVRRNHPHLMLRFSGEDAFRTREEDLHGVYDVVAHTVDRFGTPDTVGVATPVAVAQRVRTLRERYPQVALEGHFHDDRGFALMNSLEAVKSGMRFLQTTLLGIGERSGITSMTAVLFNLFIDKEYDRLEGYTLRGAYPINVMMADKLRKLVPSKEPVSLTNRTHAAGVHSKAVLNDSSTYEAHPLDQFGVTDTEILLGPLSGWNIMHYFLREICSYSIDETTAKAIAARFKQRTAELNHELSPTGLLIEIAEGEFGLKSQEVPEQFRGQVRQNMTDSNSLQEVGELRHATGVILRSA
ncbi:MAG: LeuA family protein [Chloroflexi bacterium]|nr:LeuA family protein [Chloroflexota bacterium]